MPGGNDFKKCGDYMNNLYSKYISVNPTVKMPRATFYSMRPSYLLLAKFTTCDTCLCERHQNMALVSREMKAKGINTIVHLDKFKKENTPEDIKGILQSLDAGTITFDQWKRVNDDDGKTRMKVVKMESSKRDSARKWKDLPSSVNM